MKILALIRMLLKASARSKILTSLELLIGLLMVFYFSDRLTVYRQIKEYEQKFANIAVAECENEEAALCLSQNGIVLGRIGSLQLISADEETIQGISLLWAQRSFYEKVPLKLAEGSWFGQEALPADCLAAVVPYSLKNRWPCGSTGRMNILGLGKQNVRVIGVLDSDVTMANSGMTIFSDTNKTILLSPSENGISPDPQYTPYLCGLLDETAAADSREKGIETVGLTAERLKTASEYSLAPLLFFSVALIILYICAYLGEQFLSQSERTKLFAVWYVCGAGRKDCFALQLLCDLIWVILPFGCSAAAAFMLGIRLRPAVILLSFACLMLGTAVISFFILHRIAAGNQAELIQRRFYS